MDVILAIFAVIMFMVYLFKKKKEKLSRNELPGPSGLPLFGCIFEFDESTMPSKLSEYAKKFGDVYQMKMLSDTVVVLNSAESINKAFCSEEYKHFMNDRPDLFLSKHFRSNSETAGFASGDLHKVLKKYFHQGLRTYGSGLQLLENNVMTEIENLHTKIDNMSGQVLNLDNIIQRSLTNLISLVLTGEVLSEDDPMADMLWEHVRVLEFLLSSYNNFVLSNFPFVRYLPGIYGRMCRRMKQMDETMGQRFLYQQKETYIPGKVRGLADYYIELQQRHNEKDNGFVLHDHHIISQFADVVDAGMTTSSSAILNSFAILMNYPECQKKIQEELDHVIGRDRRPTFADREKCTYLKAFEMETHRYIQVAPFGVPHMCNQDITFDGFDINANTIVLINIWHLHHDEKVWGDPWNFRPERFLDDSGNLLPKEHTLCQNLMSFGIGPRICPGQMFARTRYFLYLASLLQRWNFKFPPNQSVSCDPRILENFEIGLIVRIKSLSCIAKKRL